MGAPKRRSVTPTGMLGPWLNDRRRTPTAVGRRRSAQPPKSTTATVRATPRHSSPGWSQTMLGSWTWEHGTGIASAQLVEAGAHVLAVEPDSRMARVAAGKALSS